MWHEGEGKAIHANISVFQGDRRVLPTKPWNWAGETVGNGQLESEAPMRPAPLAGGRARNAASAGRRDGRSSEKLGKIDHGRQTVALTFEQHLPFQLGRAE